jgi:phosphatidylglycerophosphatase A
MQALLRHVATLGPIGYIPFAPGTFGSLAGLGCVWFFPLSLKTHFLFIIAGAIAGSYAATSAEKQLREKDSGKIIIDEFIGFYVAAFSLPHTISLLISAFLVFRFFDIIKPLMISKIERTLSNGTGIMADDILAGLYANIMLQGWSLIKNWV